ncbi:MAG: hypothetical protein SFV81_11380, partial [Pirellulaceae bacterium]|nr:hypothetical protein [Pirellulaceae bacterium]
MTNQTIAILRRPNELVAMVSVRKFQITAPRYGDALVVDPYEERIVSLNEVTDLSLDRLRELQKCWQRLASVNALDESVTADIKEILGSTVPDEIQPTVDPWRPRVEPKRPRATAAHPRAYRGTKAQPPSQPQAPFVDLRPHLCNLRDLRAILEHVHDRGTYADDSATLKLNAERFEDLFTAPRPIRLCQWLVAIDIKNAQANLADIIGHYWALDLNDNEPLCRAVARLLSEPWHKERLEWLHIIRHLAPHRRESALIALLENVHSLYPDSNALSRWLMRLSELSDDESFFNRVWALAQAVQRGASIEALLSGFEMANRYQPDHDFVNKLFDDCDAARGIAEWIEYVRTTTDTSWNREKIAMQVWSDCGQLAGLSKLFQKCNWRDLSPEDAFDLFDVFRDCRYSETPEAMEATLAMLLRFADRYFHTIRLLPGDFRRKGIRLLRTVAIYWEGKHLEQALERALDLIPNVCAEPFDKSCESRLYTSMLGLQDRDYATWRSGNLESLLALDRASRDHNAATLIALGLGRLANDYSSWLVEAFEQAPGPLLKCAQTFGCLSKTQHFEAMEAALLHPIACCRETELRALATRIVEHLPRGVHDPVP